MKKIICSVVICCILAILLVAGLILFEKSNDNIATDNTINLTESTTIKNSGTYNISGTLENGMLTIDTTGDVNLILDNVSITNKNGPAIYIKNGKNVTITLKDGTTSTLVDNGSSKYDGVIYSVCDLIIDGSGTLNITANNKDGIVTKDDLVVESGTINITSNDDGMRGRDSVTINDGTITIDAKGDGIKSTNDENTEKGDVTINGGILKITSKKDGIQSIRNIIITKGNITITTGTGGKTKSTVEDFGRETEKTSDEDSIKGIKATKSISITDGTLTINSEDDSINSNSNIKVSGGTFNLNSGDDGIHADGLLEITGGKYSINASEGIEATYIKINDGTIKIEASDDGINATNKSSSYEATVEITGGDLTINMGQGDTDAIDSNGNLYIKGGNINITANSPFDYDGEGKYTSGTLIVNGNKTTELTNQIMGGGMMQGGNIPAGMKGEERR